MILFDHAERPFLGGGSYIRYQMLSCLQSKTLVPASEHYNQLLFDRLTIPGDLGKVIRDLQDLEQPILMLSRKGYFSRDDLLKGRDPLNPC